jgi:hypothetical protein
VEVAVIAVVLAVVFGLSTWAMGDSGKSDRGEEGDDRD